MAAHHRNIVDARFAKTHFFELLKKVAAGKEFTITRGGVVTAKLVPVKRESTPPRAKPSDRTNPAIK